MRAIALGGIALLVIAGAAAVYLKVPLPRISIGSSPAGPRLTASDADNVTYEFLTRRLGWAVDMRYEVPRGSGDFWIFRTTDGAQHWQTQLRGKITSSGSSDLFFSDALHGFAVITGPAQLYRTVDGGSHWLRIALPGRAVQQIQFVDRDHGWLFDAEGASARNTAYVTADGGDTWILRSYPPEDAQGLYARDSNLGWLGAQGAADPHVYLSPDFGATWTRIAVPLPSDGNVPCAIGMQLIPGSDGILAAGGCGAQPFTVQSSFDLGATWKLVTGPPADTWSSLTFAAPFEWWTMSGGTLWKTIDAGMTWTQISRQNDRWDYFPHAMNRQDGWAELVSVRNPPSPSGLAFTHDGGLHWTQVNAPRP